MDVLGKHRIAFNNIGVQLFGELERDLVLVLEKGAEEKAGLQRVINDQKKLLEERNTRVQQAAKIREQKKKIDELNIELARAVAGNERLQELLNPKTSHKGAQRIALGAPSNKYLQNKENIPPIFNYLAPGASKTPTLDRSMSPSPKSPKGPTVRSSPLNDNGIQTERVDQNDEEVQTTSAPVTEDLADSYYNLAARYDALRDELNTYKDAHEELQDRYLKNKRIWEAWTKTDAERREQSKKRKRDGSVMPEVGRQIVHGYTTPATSIADQSPHSRPPPPTLSPNKPVSNAPVPHTISKRPGLFASFKRSAENTKVSDDLGIDIMTPMSIKNTARGGSTAPGEILYAESEGSDSSWPSSVPETQATPLNLARKCPGSAPAPNSTEDTDETTDGESGESRSGITLTANHSGLIGKGSPVLPPHPDPVFKVPNIKKDKLYAKHTRSGASVAHPVVIKTESSGLSSEGFGYHLFEEDSLDLDDIGYKPDTPRKRQKTSGPPTERPRSSNSNARVGWTNGGFTIKRALGVLETQHPGEMAIEETQDEDEGIMFNNEGSSVPVFPPLSMNCGELGEIRTDSQLEIPQTSPRSPSATRKGIGEVTENKETQPDSRISPPPLRNHTTSVPDQPPGSASVRRAIEEPARHNPSPQKSRARRRITSADAIANITEDDTDGIEYIGSDGGSLPHPPMVLTEKQRKELETTTRLGGLLNSPAPKTPSLARLKKRMEVSKSAPAKNSLRKSFDSISSSEPPKRKARVDPMRYAKSVREKQALHGPRKLDISHFRVNPDVNGGRDYAFAETVRNREARKCLPGCTKTCCKELAGFVEAAGLPPPAPRGPRWRSSSPPASADKTRDKEEEEPLDKKFTAKFGKHRDAFARRRSPPGFWNADFPDTQDIEKQNEAAEEMRMQRVEEMRREAEKGGGKGRYVYRD